MDGDEMERTALTRNNCGLFWWRWGHAVQYIGVIKQQINGERKYLALWYPVPE